MLSKSIYVISLISLLGATLSQAANETAATNATVATKPSATRTVAGLPSSTHPKINLTFLENRTAADLHLYRSYGYGKADLWYNMTEVYVLYRQRFPFVNRTEGNMTGDVSDSIMRTASHSVDELKSLADKLNITVLDTSGLQYFPIFSRAAGPEFFKHRGHRYIGQRGQRPAFVHPALPRIRERSKRLYRSYMLGTGLHGADIWDQPQVLGQPKIEGYEAFASCKLLLPLSRLGDLVQELPQHNATVTSVRLVPAKQSIKNAYHHSLQQAVHRASKKADMVFDTLGVKYKGLYDFKVLSSRMPHLHPIRIRDMSQFPRLTAARVPIRSRILLIFGY